MQSASQASSWQERESAGTGQFSFFPSGYDLTTFGMTVVGARDVTESRNISSKKIGPKRPFQLSAVKKAIYRQLDDHHRNPNINNRDHLFGRLREAPLRKLQGLFGHCPNSDRTPPSLKQALWGTSSRILTQI